VLSTVLDLHCKLQVTRLGYSTPTPTPSLTVTVARSLNSFLILVSDLVTHSLRDRYGTVSLSVTVRFNFNIIIYIITLLW